MDILTAERALIFRITHIENMPWILEHGVRCRSSGNVDPNFVNIGNIELIAKRAHKAVPVNPFGTLADYVPFYFTPASPMLYNIHTGYNGLRVVPNEQIVMVVSSLRKLEERAVHLSSRIGMPILFQRSSRQISMSWLIFPGISGECVTLGMILSGQIKWIATKPKHWFIVR